MSETISIKQLTHFLKQPKTYPHKADNIQIIHTHASIVALAGEKAYKIKKPVKFTFLDFSSLEKRKKVLEKELLLNKRLTEHVYLNILPVTFENGQLILDGKTGNIVEYALQMNRLADGFFLNQLLKETDDTTDLLKLLVTKLTDYYLANPTTAAISKNGHPRNIQLNTDDNLFSIKESVGKTIDKITYTAIAQFTTSYFKQNESLLKMRVRKGMIRDCHGDLRTEHVHIQNRKVNIFDCIEFNDKFRHIDIANDLAFLAMDLDFSGYTATANNFRKMFADKLQDPYLPFLWSFYCCYRACVRGKVESFKSFDQTIVKKDRTKAVKIAEKYFALALKYASLGVETLVLVCCGNIASGKSTLAGNLGKWLNLDVYSSDMIRKKSAGITPDKRSSDAERKKLYNQQNTQQLYEKLTQLALKEASDSRSIILDATFSKQHLRDALTKQFNANQTQYIFIETTVSEEIAKKRLQLRDEQKGVISDARLEDYEKITAGFEPMNELNTENYIRLDTTHHSPAELLQKVLSILVKRNIEQLKDWEEMQESKTIPIKF